MFQHDGFKTASHKSNVLSFTIQLCKRCLAWYRLYSWISSLKYNSWLLWLQVFFFFLFFLSFLYTLIVIFIMVKTIVICITIRLFRLATTELYSHTPRFLFLLCSLVLIVRRILSSSTAEGPNIFRLLIGLSIFRNTPFLCARFTYAIEIYTTYD